ncbi:MAG: PIG-L family deacetylase [Anaerolineae bacterium]|nr:PIG-L family deacetylase [Anaerolineae bacterium]NUQ05460.1 PIG-L family deacetylase [Anaerolineae bacterium]
MSKRRLLIVYAHPDDESFGLGGLIAKYVAENTQVDLICATNGEAGTISSQYLEHHGSPAAVRLAELDEAARLLGLSNVITLGYKDSGMMGTEANDDPQSLWQADVDEVTRRVVEVIRDLKPQVVITFNKYGGYGHPDHIAIQRAATRAFTLAGDAAYLTGQPPYAPQKLYYSGIATFMLQLRILQARVMREDPRRMGRNQDIDLVAILDHVEPIHARVSIAEYFDHWEAASACHRSQLGGRSLRFPDSLRRFLARSQGFTRVHPAPNGGVDERDLFTGVILEDAR